MSFFLPIFRNIFFLIVIVIISERFNIHFSRITWLVAIWSFLFCCVLNFINAPLIADIGSKVSQLLPSSIIFKIFSKRLTPGEQWKLILTTRFNLENIFSSLALEINRNQITFNVFCLFAGDDIKNKWLRVVNSNWVVISVNSLDIPVSVKNSTLGTVIYLLERIYYKGIYWKRLKVWLDIFNL